MTKLLITSLFVMIWFSAVAQDVNSPMFQEKLKTGIYERFEELKYNLPAITKPFYAERVKRKTKNWEGTYAVIPRYKENNRRVKRVWGFCDGDSVYIFHQVEFFPLIMSENELYFYGYGIIDQSGAAVAGAMGGAIGGGIYAAAELAKAKKQKVKYIINPLNGDIRSASEGLDIHTNKGDETIQIVLYRRAKKELDEAISFSINDSIINSFVPNSFLELHYSLSDNPINICYGEGYKECVKVILVADEPNYVECSMQKKDKLIIEKVKPKVGEFYSKEAKYLQDKREK